MIALDLCRQTSAARSSDGVGEWRGIGRWRAVTDAAGGQLSPEIFECRWYERPPIAAGVFVFLPVMTGLALGFGLAGFTDIGWKPIVIVGLVLVLLGYEGLFVPSHVTLDDRGVSMRAPLRRVFIAWEDLVAVERPGARRGKVKWRRRKGLAVSTPDEIIDLRRFLTTIERRAPHVTVYG
jgi:hypothetical protein